MAASPASTCTIADLNFPDAAQSTRSRTSAQRPAGDRSRQPVGARSGQWDRSPGAPLESDCGSLRRRVFRHLDVHLAVEPEAIEIDERRERGAPLVRRDERAPVAEIGERIGHRSDE